MSDAATTRRPARPDRLVTVAIALAIAVAGSARADRHCSFARESAFYAREISDEALKADASGCPAKMREAMGRLRDARDQLDICSCDPAQGPLRQWFASRPADGIDPNATCRDNASAINDAAKTVLEQVEKCF